MQRILLTGGNGMLAFDFKRYFGNYFETYSYDRNTLNIVNIESIEQVVMDLRPDIILNFAAYTKVDDAEDIGKMDNFLVNTIGVFNLSKIAKKFDIDFITISTDYVFNGENENGYDENDIGDPINEYGISKYLGEELAVSENKNTIIIRTSWLYGGGKDFKNFVNTMLKLSKDKKELKVVNDQFGLPTYTKDLGNAIVEIIDNIGNYRSKIFHFSNSGECAITWFDFASEIFKISGKEINIIPCLSSEYVTKAKRPKFSLLKNNSEIQLRNWKDGLRDYLSNL